MTTRPTASEADLRELAKQIDGYQNTALLYAAIRLELPDRMRSRVRGSAALADELGVSAPHLHRLLRALATLGVCRETGDGFVLTTLGEALGSSSCSGLRERTILAVEQYSPVWAGIDACVRSGETAFETLHGCTPWAYRLRHPEMGATFNAWLRKETGAISRTIADTIDLSGARRIVDIGGGSGSLLAALLEAFPDVSGTLFDQPHVIERAAAAFSALPEPRRPTMTGGDFFAGIPVIADVYLLKSVIHDWDDTHALRILRNCRKAAAQASRLILIERLLPEDPTADTTTVMIDMQMMLVTGGRERSPGEMQALLERSGFKLLRTIGTASAFTLIEAIPQ